MKLKGWACTKPPEASSSEGTQPDGHNTRESPGEALPRGVARHWSPAPAPCLAMDPLLFPLPASVSLPSLCFTDTSSPATATPEKRTIQAAKLGDFAHLVQPGTGLSWRSCCSRWPGILSLFLQLLHYQPPVPLPVVSVAFQVGSTAVGGGLTDGAKQQRECTPLTQIHLSRAGPRGQGISAG